MPSKSASTLISLPSPTRQIAFHQLLHAAREQWLADALSAALVAVEPEEVKKQLTKFAPAAAIKLLAASGIRDEYVFPTPVVLLLKPTLVGYYRLLLGASQKSFYSTGTGLGRFKSMEVNGTVNQFQKEAMPEFCRAMGVALGDLICQLSPSVTQRDIAELPLLTLGAQFQGGNNNTIGKEATKDVFLMIADLVKPHLDVHEERKLVIRNASRRKVIISLARCRADIGQAGGRLAGILESPC